MRVLVVDDDAPTRDLLDRVLGRSADVQVVGSAATAEEGAALAEALAPDVVLLDLLLGAHDGRDLFGSYRLAAPAAMLVALTGLTAEEAEQPTMAAGADAFHTKSPALFESLGPRLHAQLEAFRSSAP